MVDGEHDVLGWGQFIIRVGIGSVSWLRWQLKTLVTTTTKKKKSHDHEHQILLGDDVKFRMAFKPLLETRLMGLRNISAISYHMTHKIVAQCSMMAKN